MESTDSDVLDAFLNVQNKYPLNIFSAISQTIIAPAANAERFTKIPKNNPIEKKQTNFMKKATKYIKSEKIIENSL